MRTRRGKRKVAPAIVPRFLKGAVTIGVIPAIAACGPSRTQVQPVVAYMAAPPAPPDEASVTPNPPPPVVAAYAVDAQPIAPPVDAGIDAPAKKAKAKPPHPPPPVVAAMMPKPEQ